MLFFVLTIVAVFLLLIFVSFFGDFKLVFRRLGFLKTGLWFFSSNILLSRAMSMGFGSCKRIVSGTVLINLTGVEAPLKNAFYFWINCFFDYFVKAIKFLVILFYFYSYQGFHTFSKVSNYYACFWDSIQVKFYQYEL